VRSSSRKGAKMSDEKEIHGPDFVFHPEMADAYAHYRAYKEELAKLVRTYGEDGKHMITSPFQDASQQHHEMTAGGERYWASPEEVDQYYIEKMETLAMRYLAEHPEDPKPDTADHPRYNPDNKKHWYDGLF